MADPERILVRCAAEIAGWRRLWTSLLDEHIEDDHGRCRGCRSAVRLAPRWPCRPAVLATTAQALHGRTDGSDGSASECRTAGPTPGGVVSRCVRPR